MKQIKILFEIHHGLGDVVQTLSALRCIKNYYPESFLGVIVGDRARKEIVDLCDYVDEVYIFRLSSMNTMEICQFVFKLRKVRWDVGFVSPITNQVFGPIFMKLLGCQNVVYMAKRKLPCPGMTYINWCDTHKISQNMELLKAVGIPIYDKVPHIPLNRKFIQFIKGRFENIRRNDKKVIGICIGANPVTEKRIFKRVAHDIKKWQLEKYIALIELLEKDYNILILGGAKEEKEVLSAAPYLLNHIGCFINKTTFTETIFLLSQCDAVLGGDTGMIHVADALGKKTFVIYGPTDPDKVGPISGNSLSISLRLHCQYCYTNPAKLFSCKNNICIRNITVEQVYRIIIDSMKKSSEN